jgi:hypothetical protein
MNGNVAVEVPWPCGEVGYPAANAPGATPQGQVTPQGDPARLAAARGVTASAGDLDPCVLPDSGSSLVPDGGAQGVVVGPAWQERNRP